MLSQRWYAFFREALSLMVRRWKVGDDYAKSASFSVEWDAMHEVDTSGGNITATLPDAQERPGHRVGLAVSVGGNNLTATPYGSQTIDGLASWVVASFLELTSNGSNWRITASV
jgi:hypothetical protein